MSQVSRRCGNFDVIHQRINVRSVTGGSLMDGVVMARDFAKCEGDSLGLLEAGWDRGDGDDENVSLPIDL